MKNTVVRVTLGVLIFFLCWMALASWSLAAPRIAFSLLIGWVAFLFRVVSAMTVSWSGIGMVVVCSLLIVAGMHSLSTWLYAHAAGRAGKALPEQWRWSWTISLYLGVWLIFMAIMGAVGVAHQVGWLMRSKEPLMLQQSYRGSTLYDLQNLGRELTFAAGSWKADTIRYAILGLTSRNKRNPAVEDYHFVPLEGERGEVSAVAIFPRDPVLLANVGFVLVRRDQGVDPYHAEALRPLLLSRGISAAPASQSR